MSLSCGCRSIVGVSKAQDWARRHSIALFKTAVAFMSLLAVSRLGYGLWRLLFDPGGNGANDLRTSHAWVRAWFAGEPLANGTILLPATYPMLWPLLGWLGFESARCLWALLYSASLAWLIRILTEESGLHTRRGKLLAALFILSIYPTGITIGNGQVVLFVLPAVLTAVLSLRAQPHCLSRGILSSVLLLFALIKIPISGPLLLIPLLSQKALRPLMVAACGYLALTLFAMSYRSWELADFYRDWSAAASQLAATGGYGNIHIWLSDLGLGNLMLPLSLAVLVGLGIWLYGHRSVDLWFQLGVAAIVARLWTYHRLYDDLLILLPIVGVFRMLRMLRSVGRAESLASCLLALSVLGLLAPGSFLRLPFPWGTPFRIGQPMVWAGLLSVLVYGSYKARIGDNRYVGLHESTAG